MQIISLHMELSLKTQYSYGSSFCKREYSLIMAIYAQKIIMISDTDFLRYKIIFRYN